jgi:hypothetical protein
MKDIEKQFVEDTIKEICGNFCFSAYDIEKIVDAVRRTILGELFYRMFWLG